MSDTLPTLRQRSSALAFTALATALPAGLLALPFASLLGSAWGQTPGQDAVLWRPGGMWLLESMRLFSNEIEGTAHLAPWILGAYALAALVPWGTLLVSLSRAESVPLPAAIGVSIARWPTLCGLFGLATITKSLVAMGAFVLAGFVATMSKNERTESLAALGVVVLGFAAVGLLQVVLDLASAAAIRHGTRAIPALLTSLGTLRSHLIRTYGAWLGRVVLSVMVVALAGWLVGTLDVTRPGSTIAALVIHQAALFALVLVRASWLRTAIERVGANDPTSLHEAQ